MYSFCAIPWYASRHMSTTSPDSPQSYTAEAWTLWRPVMRPNSAYAPFVNHTLGGIEALTGAAERHHLTVAKHIGLAIVTRGEVVSGILAGQVWSPPKLHEKMLAAAAHTATNLACSAVEAVVLEPTAETAMRAVALQLDPVNENRVKIEQAQALSSLGISHARPPAHPHVTIAHGEAEHVQEFIADAMKQHLIPCVLGFAGAELRPVTLTFHNPNDNERSYIEAGAP